MGSTYNNCKTQQNSTLTGQERRILFTVGNVDRDMGRHSGRQLGDSWLTVGRQSVDGQSIVGR